jgi:hypothetical protein
MQPEDVIKSRFRPAGEALYLEQAISTSDLPVGHWRAQPVIWNLKLYIKVAKQKCLS